MKEKEIEMTLETIQNKSVLLTDGTMATVERGTGKAVRLATRIAKGDETMLTHAMLSLCVRLENGNRPDIGELDDLPMEDYMALMGAWSEVNFTQAKEQP
jgi:hypothetical protein